MTKIEENLQKLSADIRVFEKKYQRPQYSVSLLAMSKGQSLEKMKEVIRGGQYSFGENYVQEALAKMVQLKQPKLEWHFTGRIQSNKTRQIAEHFAWVHTLASKKIAQRLNEQRPAELPPLNICLEVNLSAEATKAGFRDESELKAVAEYCLTLPRLKLRGLMAIPKPLSVFEAQRAEFHKLVVLKENLCQLGFELDTLSMGMTADLEAAIAEGATLIRIGRGIFGPR